MFSQAAKKGLVNMKIEIEKSRVTLTPENQEEKAKVEAIWRILVDCVGDSRKLVPIGEYIPQNSNAGATFHIEGLEPGESSFVEIKVQQETEVYCDTCNKLIVLQAGDVIPICCGKMMAIVE